MNIYLAGPMRGYAEFNFPAFHEAAKRLRAHGHTVVSPADEDVCIDGFDPKKDTPLSLSHYMERDLPALCRADAIALLDGWERSEGTMLEVHVARALGKPLLRASDLEPISEEVRSVDPLTGGEKGVKPERYDLIPPQALEQLARVYGYGAQKYEARNWERGYKWGKSFAALMRHAWAFWGDEDIDPETKLPHLAHAAWHCLTLMEFCRRVPALDDRSKSGQ